VTSKKTDRDFPSGLDSRSVSYGCTSTQFGLRPSSWNCLGQFGSGSRRRSILMPRGRRPSTAAFTNCGARNASESVRLICRSVHRSRLANWAASVIEPAMISSSHRRPRAIALIRRRRRSARSGRMWSRSAPCGTRIFRNRFDDSFCQGIDKVAASVDWSVGFSERTSIVGEARSDQCRPQKVDPEHPWQMRSSKVGRRGLHVFGLRMRRAALERWADHVTGLVHRRTERD